MSTVGIVQPPSRPARRNPSKGRRKPQETIRSSRRNVPFDTRRGHRDRSQERLCGPRAASTPRTYRPRNLGLAPRHFPNHETPAVSKTSDTASETAAFGQRPRRAEIYAWQEVTRARSKWTGREPARGVVGMQQTMPSQSRKNVRRTVLVWGIPVMLVIVLVFANSAPWWLAIIAILWLLVVWGVSSSERKKAARLRAAARVHGRSRRSGVPRVSQRWESDPRGRKRR